MKTPAEHLLVEAGIDEQGITDIRKGISASERLYRALARAKLTKLADRARLGKLTEKQLIAALEKKGGHESLIKRAQAGEWR